MRSLSEARDRRISPGEGQERGDSLQSTLRGKGCGQFSVTRWVYADRPLGELRELENASLDNLETGDIIISRSGTARVLLKAPFSIAFRHGHLPVIEPIRDQSLGFASAVFRAGLDSGFCLEEPAKLTALDGPYKPSIVRPGDILYLGNDLRRRVLFVKEDRPLRLSALAGEFSIREPVRSLRRMVRTLSSLEGELITHQFKLGQEDNYEVKHMPDASPEWRMVVSIQRPSLGKILDDAVIELDKANRPLRYGLNEPYVLQALMTATGAEANVAKFMPHHLAVLMEGLEGKHRLAEFFPGRIMMPHIIGNVLSHHLHALRRQDALAMVLALDTFYLNDPQRDLLESDVRLEAPYQASMARILSLEKELVKTITSGTAS